MKRILFALLFLTLSLPQGWGKDDTVSFESYDPWPEDVVDTFRAMLIQDGGRVKPINTFARYTLLQFRGRSTMKFTTSEGEGDSHEIDASAWLLDVLFNPLQAREMPLFIVDDSAAVESIGLKQKEKRDYYSYNEIVQKRAKLAELAAVYAEKQQKFDDAGPNEDKSQFELTPVQKIVLTLGRNISAFEFLMGQFSFAKRGEDLVNSEMIPEIMQEGALTFDPVKMIRDLPEMTPDDLMGAFQQPSATDTEEMIVQRQLLFFYGRSGAGMSIFPPPVADADATAAAEVIETYFFSEEGVRLDETYGIVFDEQPATIDNLERVGTSNEIERELNQLGVYRFKQIASWTPEVAQAISEKLNLGNQIEEGGWIASARRFASEEWLSVGDVMFEALSSLDKRPTMLAWLEKIEGLHQSRNDRGVFGERLSALDEEISSVAEARNEGTHSDMEVKLIEGKFFYYSLIFFVFGFILVAFATLAPTSKAGKVITLLAVAATLIGLSYDIIGIIMRCIIRSRPPITNLYDTIIFITAVAVILCLILEWVVRNRIGLVNAVICGAAGMFLAIRYEAGEAVDTMPQLVAVLDTNFWLATHVTIINVGYAAGLLAAFLGITYLVARLFKVDGDRPETYKTITRMTYGIVCFGLLFSLVGTVLGGIWANYSWGRFWGWDPKENGALMIVLWSLVILHAKMGGYIRDIGINVMSISLGGIVIFSWWGVNNLGTGLHSYGFTEGLARILWTTYGVLALFMCLGIPLYIRDKTSKAKKKAGKKIESDEGGNASPELA